MFFVKPKYSQYIIEIKTSVGYGWGMLKSNLATYPWRQISDEWISVSQGKTMLESCQFINQIDINRDWIIQIISTTE